MTIPSAFKAVARLEEELEENNGGNVNDLLNYTNAADSTRPGCRYAFDVVIPNSTDPANEYASDADGLDDLDTRGPDSTGPADEYTSDVDGLEDMDTRVPGDTGPVDEDTANVDGLEDMDTHDPENTGPVDNEITMETDSGEESMETGEQESMETDPEDQSIETDDEDDSDDSDDSDAEFMPASNNGGLSQLPVPVRARPSRVARPPARSAEYVQWVDVPREYLEEGDDTD